MKQEFYHLTRAGKHGISSTGDWLAATLAILFALALIVIALLMLCGALVWRDLQITAIGGSLLPLFGDLFKSAFSEAIRASAAGTRDGHTSVEDRHDGADSSGPTREEAHL